MKLNYRLDYVQNLIATMVSESGVPLGETNCGKITDLLKKVRKYEELSKNVKLALENIQTLLKTYKTEFKEDDEIEIFAVIQSYSYIAEILNGKSLKELDKKYSLESQV